jgi:predicted Rossmann-fold nucleotide-binding protein
VAAVLELQAWATSSTMMRSADTQLPSLDRVGLGRNSQRCGVRGGGGGGVMVAVGVVASRPMTACRWAHGARSVGLFLFFILSQ